MRRPAVASDFISYLIFTYYLFYGICGCMVFILGTSLLNVISGGIMLAFPSVLLPALLLENNTDIKVTTDQASWINTCNGIGGFLGFFVLPPIMQIFGRKAVHIVIGFILIIGWIIFALAHSVTLLMAARTIQGLEMGSFYIQSILISEYTNPKRRGYFMSSKKAAVAVGILLCHTLSLIWNWRQIAIFAIIPATLAIVLTLFWPESPFFLAMKGRYTDSEKSFIWLHGGFKMQELHLLHYSQKQNTKKRCTEKWYKCLFKKDFMKPFVAISLLTFIIEFSGKHYFPIYAVQMITKLVEDKSVGIYVSIGADLFTLVALIFSFFIMRCFKRRTILFLFGFTTVTLMLSICLVIVFKSSTATWLAPMLIVLHNFTVNTSIIPVCYTCFGEMFSLQYKGWGNTVSGMVFVFSYTLMLKFTPVLMESTGVGGVYATYGIIVAICLLLLYGILPETKDKTLQEIENDIKGIVLSNHDVILTKNMPEN